MFSKTKVTLLLLLLLSTPCFANEFTCTIQEAGGDYNSLTTWLTANKCDLYHSTGTMVFNHNGITGSLPDGTKMYGYYSMASGYLTHTTTCQALIKNINSSLGTFQFNEPISDSPSALNNYFTSLDTGNPASAVAVIRGTWTVSPEATITLSGWNTSVINNNYVKITTTGTARHNGQWTPTAYRLSYSGTFTDIINLYTIYIIIDGLQLEMTNPSLIGGDGMREWVTNNNYEPYFKREISNNYIRCAGTPIFPNTNPRGVLFVATPSTGTYKMWNNVVEGYGEGFEFDGKNCTYYIYNNSFVKNGNNGLRWTNSESGALYIKNNLIVRKSTASAVCFYSTSYVYKSSNTNLTDDATSPNINYRNLFPNFYSFGTSNYYFVNTDTSAYHKGINLNPDSDGGIDVVYDIAGNLRANPPSISAYELGLSTAVSVITKRPYVVNIMRR